MTAGRPGRRSVALFAAAFTVFGVLQSVYLFMGEDVYAGLMRGTGDVTFVTPEATWHVTESVLPDLHRRTVAYVLGSAPEPATLSDGRPLFDANERSHLADVRAVFGAVRIAWALGGLALLAVVLAALRRGHLRRTFALGAMWSAIAVAIVGVVAAVAFEPAFLAFHAVFFPQGNFLFDPATSNMLRLWPERYWYGVTLRVGGAFIAVAVVTSLAGWLLLRSATLTRR